MLVTVLKKRWRLKFCRLRNVGGQCDPPTKRNKEIRLAAWLDKPRHAERLLAVAIHECLHAAGWIMDEDWINDTADDTARVLIKLGFERRRQ
jgi:hypothetical protein